MKISLWAIAISLTAGIGYAVPIGVTSSPDRLLGYTDPGTPANESNEATMINFLVAGFNIGTASGTDLGDNPADPNAGGAEVNVLTYTTTTIIPFPAPTAASTGAVREDGDHEDAFTLDNTYAWLALKHGTQATFYYIGDLAIGDEIDPDLTNPNNNNGLSHWTLFNPGFTPPPPPSVPDGGSTLLLLSLCLLGLGLFKVKAFCRA